MKFSPIQHKDIVFTKVYVETESNYLVKDSPVAKFVFEGVHIDEVLELTNMSDQIHNMFAVRYGLQILNTAGKICPYRMDVEVIVLFEIQIGYSPENLDDQIKRTGLSIGYSTIRDQVISITSRSIHGQLVLPSLLYDPDRLIPTEAGASRES